MIEVVPGKFISEEDAVSFINKVSDMRDLQREYFATRDSRTLSQAKKTEKEVDQQISKMRGNGR